MNIKAETFNVVLLKDAQEKENAMLVKILEAIHDNFVPLMGKPSIHDSRRTPMFYIKSVDKPTVELLYIPDDGLLINAVHMDKRDVDPILSPYYLADFKRFLEWGLKDYDVRNLIKNRLWKGQWEHIEAWDKEFNKH